MGSWCGCSATGDLQGPEREKQFILVESPLVWVPCDLGCCSLGALLCLGLALSDADIFFCGLRSELKPGMVVTLVCAPVLVCPAHLGRYALR